VLQESTVSRRLTLVIPSLELGGAERVIAQMANHWSEAGDDVTVVTLSSAASDTYALSPRVARVPLDLLRESRHAPAALWNNVVRVWKLRRALKESRPDAVISFTDRMNVTTLMAAIGLGLPVIVSERVDPARHPIGRAWSRLRIAMYPRAAAHVVQTEKVGDYIRSLARGKPVYVIPNAVSPPAPETVERSKLVKDAARPHLVAMGRLAPQKGFDLLIEAFARLASKFPQWSLRIVGEGPERAQLERQIAHRGLAGRVTLCGWTSRPESALIGCELFVLSSRYEGFPNALLEAMACGLPAISFDCESGPAEIIRHEVDGLLVPAENVEELARAMERLMSDEAERRRLGEKAREVTGRFGPERYFDLWETVLREGASAATAGH